MDPHEITAISVGVVTAVVFILTFLMGDIVGVIIEARSKRQWRRIGQEMGFEFYGTKTRNSSLSKFFLSKVIGPETDESAFCYCDLLKTLTGRVGRLKVLIADFTVWNLHTRGPLVYRVVLCLLTGEGLLLLNPLAIARRNSVLIPGFRLTQTLREYRFPQERAFTVQYVLFGRPGTPPWAVGPDLRQFCMSHRRDIDCFHIDEGGFIFVWADRRSKRIPELVQVATGIVELLLETVPTCHSNTKESTTGL